MMTHNHVVYKIIVLYLAELWLVFAEIGFVYSPRTVQASQNPNKVRILRYAKKIEASERSQAMYAFFCWKENRSLDDVVQICWYTLMTSACISIRVKENLQLIHIDSLSSPL